MDFSLFDYLNNHDGVIKNNEIKVKPTSVDVGKFQCLPINIEVEYIDRYNIKGKTVYYKETDKTLRILLGMK